MGVRARPGGMNGSTQTSYQTTGNSNQVEIDAGAPYTRVAVAPEPAISAGISRRRTFLAHGARPQDGNERRWRGEPPLPPTPAPARPLSRVLSMES